MENDHKKIIEAIEKVQKIVWENEKKKDLGTRKNPYILYQSSMMYDYLKKHNLIDEDDMYLSCTNGWCKVVVVDLNKGVCK